MLLSSAKDLGAEVLWGLVVQKLTSEVVIGARRSDVEGGLYVRYETLICRCRESL